MFEPRDTSNVPADAIQRFFAPSIPSRSYALNVSLAGAGRLVNCNGTWTNVYTLEQFPVSTGAAGSFLVPNAGAAQVTFNLSGSCVGSYTQLPVGIDSGAWVLPQVRRHRSQ